MVNIEILKLTLKNKNYSEVEREINTMWIIKYYRQWGNLNVTIH